MRRLSVVILAVLSLATPATVYSQTSTPVWFTLDNAAGDTITATGSITLRFGQLASTCVVEMGTGPCTGGPGTPTPETWTPPQTFTAASGATNVTVVADAAAFNNVDPLPGVNKTVQVEEQATVQNITVDGQPVTIPSAPVWFTLNAPEGDTVTATGSITLRFGQVASTCAVEMSPGPCSGGPGTPTPEAWTTPQTFTAVSGVATVSVLVGAAAFNNVDPLPGVYKTVQVQEQATVQNITVNGQPVTVPALPTSSTSVWFTLDNAAGDTITATGSITLRFGQLASTCVVEMGTGPCTGGPGTPTPETWTPPKTFTAASGATTVTVVANAAAFNNVDPLPGVNKTVQVEEQATVQNITVNGQPVTVPALSTSPTCQLTATPSSITFPNTTLGYNDSSLASIANDCPTTITVSVVQVVGPYSTSGFETPFSLAPGQTLNYTTVFAPTTTGTVTGSITFVSNATTGQTLSVSLTGTGIASQQGLLSSSPAALNFGNVTVNSTQSQNVTITNTGAASVTVSAVTVVGAAFSLSNLTTPFTLGPQQSIQLAVGFAPTTSGSAAGTLTITSNAQNGTLTVPLAGTSANHSVALSWNGTGSQISGYNVYRSIVSGGPYSMINGTLVIPSNYTDQTVIAGTTYFYTVTEVGTNGAESGYSNEASVVVPSP